MIRKETRGGRRRWRRRAGIAMLSLSGAALLVEATAAARVRRARAERAPLDGRLYAEARGEGDPVVFLAGLPGSTSYWSGNFEALAPGRRLLFLDALGFGRSPWPDADYTLDEHLAALRRTLLAEGATRNVTFVAHSFGTLLAAHYAARHPGEVRSLVLLGTPVFEGERDARRRIRRMSTTAGLFSLNPVIAREACKLHEAFGPAVERIAPRLRPDLPAGVVRGGLLHTWRSFHGTLENVVLRRPIAVPLERLGPRVTLVHGRADAVTSLGRVQALAGRIGARVVVTEDSHESYSYREPEAVVRAIEDALGSRAPS